MTHSLFATRLEVCAKKVGSKRALAKKIGISEAQLFRYLRGESEPTAAKIQAIAETASVDPTWLLTGSGAPDTEPADHNRLVHSPQLFQTLYETFEQAQLELQHILTPVQKAEFLEAIYADALHQPELADIEEIKLNYNTLDLLFKIHYLIGIRPDKVKNYREFMEEVFKANTTNWGDILSESELEPIVNHICRASTDMYNSPATEFLFDNLGRNVSQAAAQRLNAMLAEILEKLKKPKISLLDLGCGNGRELSYIHRHYENINVYGIDNSELCLSLCKQHITTQALPENSIVKGDLRFLPFSEETFDVVYSRQTLYQFPYIPNTNVGLTQVFQQVHKTLKSGGLFNFITRSGDGCEFVPFIQLLNTENVEKLAKETGFQIIHIEEKNFSGHLGKITPLTKGDRCITALLQKI